MIVLTPDEQSIFEGMYIFLPEYLQDMLHLHCTCESLIKLIHEPRFPGLVFKANNWESARLIEEELALLALSGEVRNSF